MHLTNMCTKSQASQWICVQQLKFVEVNVKEVTQTTIASINKIGQTIFQYI